MTQIQPLAKTLAESNGIEWQHLSGTGQDGSITEADVVGYLTAVMNGEADPPSEPVDPPPPDWDGTVPSMPQELLEQAGIDSDIAAFVHERTPSFRDNVQVAPPRPVPEPALPPLVRDDVQPPLPSPVPEPRRGLGGLLSKIYPGKSPTPNAAPATGEAQAEAVSAAETRPFPQTSTPQSQAPTPKAVTPTPVQGIWAVPKLGQTPRPDVLPSLTPTLLDAEEFELDAEQASPPRAGVQDVDVRFEPQPAAVDEETAHPVQLPAVRSPLTLTPHSPVLLRVSVNDTDLLAVQRQVSALLGRPVSVMQWVSLSVQARMGGQAEQCAVYLQGVLQTPETPQSLRGRATGDVPLHPGLILVDAGAHGADELLFSECPTLSVRHDPAAGHLYLTLSGQGLTGATALLDAVKEDLLSPLRLLLL